MDGIPYTKRVQQKRSRVVWFIVIGIAFFAIVDPFRLFVDNQVPRMRVNSQIRAEMAEFLAASPSAADFIVGALDRHDVVLIGESGFVREHLVFLTELIPVLDRAGIHHLGFQYANRTDQQRIDALLTAPSFDEALAHNIMFSHQVVQGYQEIANVFRAAWEVNRSKGPDEPRFSIIGVGFTPDYSHILEPGDESDPDVLRAVFANGIPDAMMAAAIQDTFLDQGIRAPVYLRMEHAFTGFVQPLYAKRMEEQGFPGQLRTGNRLRERHGQRVISAILHSPLRDTRSRIGFGFPIGGTLDDLVRDLPAAERSRGFFVAESPYSEAPISSDVLREGIDGDLLFNVFADAYLIVADVRSVQSLTAIPEFINEDNIDDAISRFPGPDPGPVSMNDLNEFIAGNAAQIQRVFDEFK